MSVALQNELAVILPTATFLGEGGNARQGEVNFRVYHENDHIADLVIHLEGDPMEITKVSIFTGYIDSSYQPVDVFAEDFTEEFKADVEAMLTVNSTFWQDAEKKREILALPLLVALKEALVEKQANTDILPD